MPPLPPVTDPPAIRVAFATATGATVNAGSRFFLSYAGSAPSSADLVSLATAVEEAWVTHIAPSVCSSEQLVSVLCTDLSSDSGQEGEWTGSESGSGGSDPLIASACMVVNHHILRRYRGGRPRTYLRCGDTSVLAEPNIWTTAFQTQVREAWEAFIAEVIATTGIGVTSLALVNVSNYSGNTVYTTPSGRARNIPKLRVGGPITDIVTLSTVAEKIGSQRKRLDI
jgi:hypothetical protein